MIKEHLILKIQRGLIVVCLLTSSLAFAETAYIPVQSGQTLLQIAKKAHPNYSVSIQQLAYAIYKLNPDAFDNNMNALKQGSKLRLPEKNKVLDLSKSLANKKITQHEHEILILRASAKRLSAAKKHYQSSKQKVRLVRNELAKYKHKSTNWNLAYLKFVTARRAEKKAARNVKRQSQALLAKAELSKKKSTISKPTVSEPSPPKLVSSTPKVSETIKTAAVAKTDTTEKQEEDLALVKVEEKISELQAQVQVLNDAKVKEAEQYELAINTIKNELDTSKQQLVTKTSEQEVIIQRVDVLESDQAEKEKLILGLQSSLKETTETIQQQQAANKELLKQMQTLSSDTLALKQQQEKQQLKAIQAAEALLKAKKVQEKEQTMISEKNQLHLVQDSFSYWQSRIKERPLITFSIVGSLLVLLLFYVIKRQKISRKKTKETISQLESKLRSSPINNRKITI